MVTPASSAAAAVTTLKVEPGSYASEINRIRIRLCKASNCSRGGLLGS